MVRKCLYITTNFPPTRGSGSRRSAAVTKYLARLGWEIFVLTFDKKYYDFDEADSVFIPREENVKVVRTKMMPRPFKIFQYFAVPDKFFGWLPYGYKAGLEIIKKENIKVIYATAPYFSALVLGWLLAKKTGAKLVAEFRDPWTSNLDLRNRFFASLLFDKIRERKILSRSAGMIAVTDGIRKKLEGSLPASSSKTTVISNGFDPENSSAETKPADIFTLTYAGTLKDGRQKTLEIFLAALAGLIKNRRIQKEKIRINFLGDKPALGAFGEELRDVVGWQGRTDHLASLKTQKAGAALLFFDNQTGSASVPAKIYEYFASARPILAFTQPDSYVAEIVKRTNAGICLSGEEETQNLILDFYNKFYSGNKIEYHPNPEELKKFSYPVLAEKISGLLEKIL